MIIEMAELTSIEEDKTARIMEEFEQARFTRDRAEYERQNNFSWPPERTFETAYHKVIDTDMVGTDHDKE